LCLQFPVTRSPIDHDEIRLRRDRCHRSLRCGPSLSPRTEGRRSRWRRTLSMQVSPVVSTLSRRTWPATPLLQGSRSTTTGTTALHNNVFQPLELIQRTLQWNGWVISLRHRHGGRRARGEPRQQRPVPRRSEFSCCHEYVHNGAARRAPSALRPVRADCMLANQFSARDEPGVLGGLGDTGDVICDRSLCCASPAIRPATG